jgi:hypothetical protein
VDPNDNETLGFLLTATGSGYLASITAPMGYIPGSSTGVSLTVYANNGGAPGAVLDTLSATVGAFGFGLVNANVTFSSTECPLLTSGQSYWVIASGLPSGPADELGWNVSSVLAAPGNRYATDNGEVINVGGGAEGALTLTGTATSSCVIL